MNIASIKCMARYWKSRSYHYEKIWIETGDLAYYSLWEMCYDNWLERLNWLYEDVE